MTERKELFFTIPRLFRLFLKKWMVIRDSFGNKTVTVHSSSKISSAVLDGKNLVGADSVITNCRFGFGTYVNSNTHLANVIVGSYSSISSNVKMINGLHPSRFVSTYPGFYSNEHSGIETYSDGVYFKEYAEKTYLGRYSTYIGNDVLIGSGAVLIEGVKIGDGAIVLPYALVNHDVEPYSVVGGIPAARIKYRFEKKDRELLLKSEWWNRDRTWFKKHWKLMLDLEEFKKGYDELDKENI